MLNTVLLIDDDPVNNFLTTRTLLKAGIKDNNIITANNGQEGMNELIRSNVQTDTTSNDIVFLDLDMPVMDGFEFIELFKEMNFINRENIKIIVLTSSPNPKDIAKVKALGIQNYLQKPLTIEKIKELISR